MSTTGAVVAAAVSLNGSLPILGPPPTYSEAVACPSPVTAQSLPTTSAAAATTTTPDSAAAAQRLQPSIWTVPLPLPDVSQMTPPPSYAESLAANALAASRLHTCSRQQHNHPASRTTPAVASSRHHQPHHHHHQNNQQQSAPNAGQCQQQHSALAQRLSSPICARHLHRCPSNSRRNSNGSNGTGTGGANHQNANNSSGHRATGRRTSLHLVFPADQTAAGNGTSNRNAAPARDQESATNGTACADRFRDLFLTILMRVLLIFLFVVFMRILITQLSPEES